jgi:hypothetical protein
MSLPVGFRSKHLRIWGLRRDGVSLTEIGRRLGVTKQAIHRSARDIEAKVARTLEATARAAKIEVRHLDPRRGILLGYSHALNDRVLVTFSTRRGVNIWHHHANNCDSCELLGTCREVILDEAAERGVTLTDAEQGKPPAELARLVFARVLPGLEP